MNIKKILAVVLSLCMLTALVACGGAKEADYKLGMGVVVNMDSSADEKAQVDATVAAVVTDKDGKIVDAEFSSITWNGAWTRNIFAGFFPRMPQTAGDYTLTIYFNNQFTAEKDFTVNAAS